MGVQLTPGQGFLLDILQKKLIGTLQTYARLSRERRDLLQKLNEQQGNYQLNYDDELARLREKIKRISARQKRFTSEIINGNGTNTIPKESFFKALGLVTKETLSQITSKSSERRRRTTANPRFSHEAIQAKKALQKPRVEPKVAREKRISATASATTTNTTSAPTSTNATSTTTTTTTVVATTKQASFNNNNTNHNNNNNINHNHNGCKAREPQMTLQEKRKLAEEYLDIYEQIESKARQIKMMLESIKRLDQEKNELVDLLRKHPIELSAIDSRHPTAAPTETPSNDTQQQPQQPVETWLKCNESIEGID